MHNPEAISRKIARPMIFLSKLTAPVVKFLGFSTELGLKLFGIKLSNTPDISEDEIRLMLIEGTEVGVFEESEHDMVEGVFRLGDRRVDMIVTPRTELEWLNLEDPLESWDPIIFNTRFNQLPVVEGELDQVIGVIRTRDILKKRLTGEIFDPQALILPAVFIPESMPALTALQLIKENSSNMAMVIDEYGGLLGIVTLFDVMEAIIGDIAMGDTPEDGSIVERADGSWLIDGLLAMDELKELLELNTMDGESEYGYQTLGGLMMAQMGKIPRTGQSFVLNGFRFEVVDMDGRRVDKVMVNRIEAPIDGIYGDDQQKNASASVEEEQ
jgi:putative hemolysin